MIVILSQDPDSVRAIARNQANTSQAIFGPSRNAFVPTLPLAAKENLFIVAKSAKRGPDWRPVIGDESSQIYWNAAQAMLALDRLIPANYSGNVYISACEVAAPDSNVTFASAFKTQLLAVRRTTGKIFGQSSAALGPIPPPDDTRWIEAKAA